MDRRHVQSADQPDRAFFHVLGIVFAAMITLAATMSMILSDGKGTPPTETAVLAFQR